MDPSPSQPRVNGEQFLVCLEKLKHSPQFKGSDTLFKFLQHVVKRTVAGEFDQLKGSALTADLYPEEAKKHDPEGRVRVTASKVRKKLEEYSGSAAAQGEVVSIGLCKLCSLSLRTPLLPGSGDTLRSRTALRSSSQRPGRCQGRAVFARRRLP